jgi:hypothetical protein
MSGIVVHHALTTRGEETPKKVRKTKKTTTYCKRVNVIDKLSLNQQYI